MSRIGLEEFALGVLGHNGDDSTSEPSVVDDEYDSDQLLEDNMEDPWSPKSLEDKWKDVVQRLINNEVCWDVDKDRDVKILDPKEKESLTDVDNRNKTCPTVLHRLAHKFEDGDFSKLLPETRTQVVGYLLNARKESKNIADSLHDPILTRAFEYENIAFIDLIINNFENHIPDLVDDQDSGGANCLHYIFKKHLPECIERRWPPPYTRAKSPTTPKWDHTLSSIFHLINSAKPCSIVASDSEGNTPIHYALAYRVSRGTSKYLRIIVLKLIKAGDKSNDRSRQFNKAQQSPYLYLSHTRQEFLRDAQQRSHSAAITSQRTGSQNISSNPGSKFGPGQTRSTRDEMGSRNVKGQYLDNSKDVPMKEARFKFPPSQHNKDNMKRDVRTVKQQLRPDSPKSFSLTRQNTSGPRDNLTDALRPEPPTASPDVEVGDLTPTCRQENTTSLNSGQNVVSGETPLTAESPLHGQQNGRESTGGSAKEATQELKDLKKRKTDREKEERCLEAAENMHQQLKLHYIRSRSDVEAKELLYGRIASDKNLYFDATNLKGKTSKEVADLVTMLANPGGFEDILSYVSLPVLSYTKDLMSSSSQSSRNYDANERRQRSMSGYGDKTTGRNSAVAVLDKLAEFGVRKVIRLIVEEDLKSPHTDAAIERAICGKDSMQPEHGRKYPGIAVEVWDWKKCDLSTDVIRFASPKVSEVNLYWTGNQIVLKGWASKEGIPRLFVDSEKRLKTVNIFWSPGFETVQRCESLLVDFQKQVKTQTSDASDKRVPSGVTVNTRRLSMGVVSEGEDSGHQGPFTLGDPRAPPEHGWIESMEMFRKALMALHSTLPKELKVRRVKVALIDDGVDRANLNTYQDRVEVTGMSYWTSSMGMSLQNPSWHQSTHGHGTIMANSIIRINPWVSLYAMRIQDEVNTSSRGEVSIRIHAGSAARAIEDAVIRKVDIISISWTIQNITAQGARATHGEEGKAIEALKSAINNARRQGILIFCSASDDVKKKGTDTLPYSAASDYIFRIGAADAYGWSDKATEDQRAIDYFLPGSQVVDDFNPRMVRKEELKYRDGSSVATALAAGLASIVLYMTSLLEVHYDTNVENKTRFSKYGESLRRRDGLKKAFENIITNDFRDKKFLPVWESFRSRADLILNNPKDLRKNWEILEVLCTKLAV